MVDYQIPVGDETLHVEVTGEGKPVLLWHSLLCDGGMWRYQVPALSQHYQVINLDMRGHGKSSLFNDSYNYWELSQDVGRVLDYLNLDSVVMIGLSMGGMAAYHVAVNQPQRLTGIVSIAASATPDAWMTRLRYRVLAESALRMNPHKLRQFIDPLMLGETSLQQRPSVVELWEKQFQAIRPKGIYHAVKVLNSRENLLSSLSNINIPTLVLVGDEDKTEAGKNTKVVADVIPNAQFSIIPQAGHLCVLEQPKLINELLLRFLEEIFD